MRLNFLIHSISNVHCVLHPLLSLYSSSLLVSFSYIDRRKKIWAATPWRGRRLSVAFWWFCRFSSPCPLRQRRGRRRSTFWLWITPTSPRLCPSKISSSSNSMRLGIYSYTLRISVAQTVHFVFLSMDFIFVGHSSFWCLLVVWKIRFFFKSVKMPKFWISFTGLFEIFLLIIVLPKLTFSNLDQFNCWFEWFLWNFRQFDLACNYYVINLGNEMTVFCKYQMV